MFNPSSSLFSNAAACLGEYNYHPILPVIRPKDYGMMLRRSGSSSKQRKRNRRNQPIRKMSRAQRKVQQAKAAA